MQELVDLFYDDPAALGELSHVDQEEVPPEYARLLDHEEHMTVAIEAFYESLVNVDVLETKTTPTHYARKIILRRQTDGGVVQFGIMRIASSAISSDVRQEIESQSRPLGRILVRHNILRTIHLDNLWRVAPGKDLCQMFGLSAPRETFGRTASIDLDGTPAVELLEIVAPI